VTFLKRYHDNVAAPAITANANGVAGNVADIAANTTNIAGNATAIGTNTSGVATNAAAIAAIPAPGVPGLQIVQGATVTLPGLNVGDATATCPAGERLTGGGYITSDGVPNIDVFRSRPFSSTQWKASGKNTTTPTSFWVYTICATAP